MTNHWIEKSKEKKVVNSNYFDEDFHVEMSHKMLKKWEQTNLLKGAENKKQLASCLESQRLMNEGAGIIFGIGNAEIPSQPSAFKRIIIPLVIRVFRDTSLDVTGYIGNYRTSVLRHGRYMPVYGFESWFNDNKDEIKKKRLYLGHYNLGMECEYMAYLATTIKDFLPKLNDGRFIFGGFYTKSGEIHMLYAKREG